jgi:hypothetical protein
MTRKSTPTSAFDKFTAHVPDDRRNPGKHIRPSSSRDSARLDTSKWLTDRGVPYRQKDKKTADGRDVYVLKQCPFDPEHGKRGEVCIMQDQSGRLSFKCHHPSCSEHGWQDAKEVIGPPESSHYDGPSEANIPSLSFAPKLMTSQEFAEAQFNRHYLVNRVLAAGQPCIIGGPKKCLKTSVLADLVISLATGTPFLAHPAFLVPNRVKVCFLSGESGDFTLQETAQRVCAQRGCELASTDVLWGFELPQLANPVHLDAIAEIIEQEQVEVLIIDPAYLCLLSGTSSVNPADVFAMGSILKEVGELGKRTGCTIVIAHHTRKKDRRERSKPTDLEDLAMSGFAEWARQWIMLGRMGEYLSDGHHELWLNIGGSAGHGGSYALSVDEGVANDDGGGRVWEPRVEYASEFVERSKELAQQRKRDKSDGRWQQKLAALKDTLMLFPDGETKSRLRNACKPQPTATEFDSLMAELIEQLDARSCEVVKNGSSYPGFEPCKVPF